MVKYCAGKLINEVFLYIGGPTNLTTDLTQAWTFTENQIKGNPVGVKDFVWLPIFCTEDLLD